MTPHQVPGGPKEGCDRPEDSDNQKNVRKTGETSSHIPPVTITSPPGETTLITSQYQKQTLTAHTEPSFFEKMFLSHPSCNHNKKVFFIFYLIYVPESQYYNCNRSEVNLNAHLCICPVNSIDLETMPMNVENKTLEDLTQNGPRPILPYSSMFVFGQTNP